MQKPLHKIYENDKDGDEEAVYAFDANQENDMFKESVPKITTGKWQIFPSACASLTCIPFGLMLGWPSSTYPTLLEPDSPVPITLDQSALIAGFLMLGVCFGTIFSTKQIALGPKYGIIVGNIFMMLGWIVMWQAQDIYGLLGSRFLIGTGQGYVLGQIKDYIKEMTEDLLSVLLIKQLNFYGFFGFVLAYVIGLFVGFRQYSFISLVISVFILFLAIFLPSTPRELIRAKKIQDAKKLLVFLKPNLNPEQETDKIVQKLTENSGNSGLTKIMRHTTLRINFIKLTIILFCQQYCGAPPTLVYTQILFRESGVPYSEYIALIYAVLFFFSTIVGTYVAPRYNKKVLLLISSCGVLILCICKTCVIYFKVNENCFSYTSVIVMYLFIFVHTIGLGNVPFLLINDWFPKDYTIFVTKYVVILQSLLALTITKIFQVLLGQFNVYIPFCLFSSVITFGIIFIGIFVPYNTSQNINVYTVGTAKKCDNNKEIK